MTYVVWILAFAMKRTGKRNIRVFVALAGLFTFGVVKSEDFAMPNEFGPSDFPEDIIEAFSANPLGGTVTALLGAPRHRASRLQLSYYKSAKETLDIKVFVGNLNKTSVRYRVVFLVDYKQTQYLINGKNIWSYEFELQPPVKSRIRPQNLTEFLRSENVGAAYQEQPTMLPIPRDRERRTIEASIPDIGYGAHDVLMVIISEYAERLHDELADTLPIIAYRFNVYSGSRVFHTVKSAALDTVGSASIQSPLAHLRSSAVTRTESGASRSEDLAIELNNANVEPKRIAIGTITQSEDGPCAGLPATYYTLLQRAAVRLSNPDLSRCLATSATAVVVEEPYNVLENPHGKIVERPMDIVFLSPKSRFR